MPARARAPNPRTRLTHARARRLWCGAFWTVVGLAAIVTFVVVFPRFVDGAITPFIRLLQARLRPAQIGAVVAAALIILPATITVGIVPFVWLAGELLGRSLVCGR